jgi:hypothetical protein
MPITDLRGPIGSNHFLHKQESIMTSTTIYTIAPTYLYIKQHSVTGLKYFGKTTKDPYKYLGSGKYWLKHINKHDKKFIQTIWVSELYTDKNLLSEFALFFSEEYDIVKSKDWANLKPEDGLDGWTKGVKHKKESIQKRIDTINSNPEAKAKQYEKRAITMSLKSKEEYDEMCSKISRSGNLNPMFGKDRPDLALSNIDPILNAKRGKSGSQTKLTQKIKRFGCNSIEELIYKINTLLKDKNYLHNEGCHANTPNLKKIAETLSLNYKPSDKIAINRFIKRFITPTDLVN